LHAAPRTIIDAVSRPTGSARPAAVASIGVDPLIRVNTGPTAPLRLGSIRRGAGLTRAKIVITASASRCNEVLDSECSTTEIVRLYHEH
jgi:hypothetical protein